MVKLSLFLWSSVLTIPCVVDEIVRNRHRGLLTVPSGHSLSLVRLPVARGLGGPPAGVQRRRPAPRAARDAIALGRSAPSRGASNACQEGAVRSSRRGRRVQAAGGRALPLGGGKGAAAGRVELPLKYSGGMPFLPRAALSIHQRAGRPLRGGRMRLICGLGAAGWYGGWRCRSAREHIRLDGGSYVA